MKFTRKHISILLILLIGLSNISSTSLRIKSNKKRALVKTQMSSKEAAENILGKLQREVTDPANIAFFAMGVLSNWFPKVELLYQKIKGITYFFKPCYKFIETTWAMVHGTSKENLPTKKKEHDEKQGKIQNEINKEVNKINELEAKDDSATAKDMKKLCTKTKEAVNKIWLKSVNFMFELKSNNERDAFIRGSDSLSAERYCNFAVKEEAVKAKKAMLKKFESKEDFMEICLKIRESSDCSQYTTDNKGAWYFVKKSIKYVMFMKNGTQCLFNLIKIGGKDDATSTPKNQEIENLANTALGTWAVTKLIFKEFGAFLMHLVTFGIFGALRAAWNILKLTLKIYVMVNRLIFDIPYNIGKLVGLAIKVMKAFFLGRRRRK